VKKVSTFLSAAMVAALGVVPFQASPAFAVQRCEHQEADTVDGKDGVMFDFCIRADQNAVKVSIENFRCYTNDVDDHMAWCEVRGGVLETLKNGSPTHDQLPRIRDNHLAPYGYWQTTHAGCEEGDFVKAYIDDLHVTVRHYYGSDADNVPFVHPFMHSGVRC
jgi:hypothetical protein